MLHVPANVASTAGDEAADIAASAGLVLDDAQRFALDVLLSEQDDGRWSCFEGVVNEPRQNGKGGIIEARELFGLFVLGESLILHTAHEAATSRNAFFRLLKLVEDSSLRAELDDVKRSNQETSITIKGGSKVRFITRTKGAGRGFTAPCVVFDEAYELDAEVASATLPTLLAIPAGRVGGVDHGPGAQALYFSSAPLRHSQQLHALRRRALRGVGDRLGYLEWSIDPEVDSIADPASWAKANPALGSRIPLSAIRALFESMTPETFAREILGVPDEPLEGSQRLTQELWLSGFDRASCVEGEPLAVAWDVNHDRSSSCFAVAGRRRDGAWHVELIDRRPGVSWVAGRARELYDRYGLAVAVDPRQAGGQLALLEAAGVPVLPVPAGDFARACAALVDELAAKRLFHLGQDEMLPAVAGVSEHETGDAFTWVRKTSTADISPLVAVTLALYAALAPEQAAPSLW